MWISLIALAAVSLVVISTNASVFRRYGWTWFTKTPTERRPAFVTAGTPTATPQYAAKVGTVQDSHIREASGLCYNRIHDNVLYTHNDSGGGSRLYAIDATNGRKLSTITVEGAGSHDWEDVACGPCPDNGGRKCIYIGDIGGNVGHSSNNIYRIVEPSSLHGDITVRLDSTLRFSWGEHNAETLMVDPNGEIYVVSKVDGGHGKMIQLPKSAWGSHHRVSVDHGIHLDLDSSRNDPVGGDISPTGYEVLIKTINAVNYYYVPDGDYLGHMTQRPTQLPYDRDDLNERQGEAIAWDAHAKGYYTLGEGSDKNLYFYERQVTDAIFG